VAWRRAAAASPAAAPSSSFWSREFDNQDRVFLCGQADKYDETICARMIV